MAASSLCISIIIFYSAIRNNHARPWQTAFADWTFIGGVLTLMLSVLVAAIFL